MEGSTQPHVPVYISSRSADVILSDIRPTKLNIEALHSINVLLDELLYSILNAARSLATNQLRAGLYKVLPTALGKEALLEAEVELRAHWERTGRAAKSNSFNNKDGEKGSGFYLQWTFELLRLKCEAYSTLSDVDEDPQIEARLYGRMDTEGIPHPEEVVFTRAALYLTAILESICEHILSNVGRVATRDSSRATANTQDLFTALCEDSSIYPLFKIMKVYAQIESYSKAARPQQSNSFSRDIPSDLLETASRESEPPHKQAIGNGNDALKRTSVDFSHPPPTTSTRASFDTTRAIKTSTANNRTTSDPGAYEPSGHNKVESTGSTGAKQSLYSASPISATFSNDSQSQEFDSMMRSGSTMKVSLTPDRLRTMEVFNREKERQRQKTGARTSAQGSAVEPSQVQSTLVSRSDSIKERAKKLSLRHVQVGSIVEDEELLITEGDELASAKPEARQLSSAPASQISAGTSLNRFRTSSTSTESAPPVTKSPFFPTPTRYSSRSESAPFPMPSVAMNPNQKRERHIPKPLDINTATKTRRIARNRESLDLDDVMGMGSPDTGDGEETRSFGQKYPKVSASARELIEFLAEGPPEVPEFTRMSGSTSSLTTPKKSGRLKKMMSKLTLNGSAEKVRDINAEPRGSASHPVVPLLPNKSMTNLNPLANRPVPPRYPPASPSSFETTPTSTSLENNLTSDDRLRAIPISGKTSPGWDIIKPSSPEYRHSLPDLPVVATEEAEKTQIVQTPLMTDVDAPKQQTSPSPPVTVSLHMDVDLESTRVSTPVQISIPDPVPVSPVFQVPQRTSSLVSPTPLSTSTSTPSVMPSGSQKQHAQEMRRLLSHATSAEECRLIVDIYLARSNLPVEGAVTNNPSSLDAQRNTSQAFDDELQTSLVEFLLDGDREQLPT